jgi:H+/Cl- antiporter ClcA/predicted transcriptional regulator
MNRAARNFARSVRSYFSPEVLGDYTIRPRTLLICGIAICIGAVCAVIALVLLRLIGLFTNIFFYQRLSTAFVSPANNTLGPFVIIVPVIGGLIVGVMARFGSDRIRGHGIPEAIEAILINGSRMQPKVAVLKPVSAAIAIGSGGPFGAEGPIIMTGGAVGSLIAQFLHLTNAERKTLLVAGAAGGMSAIFASPIAAVILAVELLLFEWKPRSLIPVALASAVAAALRPFFLGSGPLFPTPPHVTYLGPTGLLACVVVGVATGALGMALSAGVYASEDGFRKLPIHWMWWPAIGGVVIGIGGLIFPRALGVGYDNIAALLSGQATANLVLGILIVKSIIWTVSLGSGTSAGVLAPLLMIGAAMGGLFAPVLPNGGPGFWPMIGMAAMVAAAMRAPLTGVVFTIELTHDVNSFLPLLIAVAAAYAFSVLFMHRSILTEKISRRGYHVSNEYAIDPLEILFVREAMRPQVVSIPSDASLAEIADPIRKDEKLRRQALYPVLTGERHLVGIVTRGSLLSATSEPNLDGRRVTEILQPNPVVAYPDEPLRAAVYRMAERGVTRLPVVTRERPRTLVGMITLRDLLVARARNLDDERRRERVLQLRMLVPRRFRRPSQTQASATSS